MVSIWFGLAARYQAVSLIASSRGSLIGASVRIDCGTTLDVAAGTRFWATSCSAFSSSYPHGIQFGDAIPKLKGLARYAEACGDQYRRIEAVAKIGDTFRVLDLMEQSTRAAIAAAASIKALYESDAAADYLV